MQYVPAGDNACGGGHYRTLEAEHDMDMKTLIVHFLAIRLKGAILMFVSGHMYIIIQFVYATQILDNESLLAKTLNM